MSVCGHEKLFGCCRSFSFLNCVPLTFTVLTKLVYSLIHPGPERSNNLDVNDICYAFINSLPLFLRQDRAVV